MTAGIQNLQPTGLLMRIRRAGFWLAAQLIAFPLLFLVGLGWTRIPEGKWYDVGLTLLIAPMLVLAALALVAITMRKLRNADDRRAPLWQAIVMLLVWCVVIYITWRIVGWCQDHFDNWASWLNSETPASARARVFTYPRINHGLEIAAWAILWIAIPAKVVIWALETSSHGWRINLRPILRVLFSWRWWLVAIVAALIGVLLPGHFFSGDPSGSTSHQVWVVAFKILGAYIVAMLAWFALQILGAHRLDTKSNPAAPAKKFTDD